MFQERTRWYASVASFETQLGLSVRRLQLNLLVDGCNASQAVAPGIAVFGATAGLALFNKSKQFRKCGKGMTDMKQICCISRVQLLRRLYPC